MNKVSIHVKYVYALIKIDVLYESFVIRLFIFGLPFIKLTVILFQYTVVKKNIPTDIYNRFLG